MAIEEGRVEYRGRAFQQDAEAAMNGDVVRALIELITNADDAYRGSEGSIEIVVGPSSDVTDDPVLAKDLPVALAVHDAARGLPAEGLKKCFAVLGGENRQFMDGEHVRGLLGRGAKDVAGMGQVRFESIHNGLYSSFVLDNSGGWKLLAADRPPRAEDWDRLRLKPGAAGLTATMLVKKAYRVPPQRDLAEKIRDHVQLRKLVGRRQVILEDHRKALPAIVIDPRVEVGETIIESSLPLGGGYGNVTLSLRKLPKKQTKPLSDYSEHGIVVSGQTASYMNTLFGQHGRPESGWLAGELVCPQIEELVRQYDDGNDDGEEASAENPLRLVSRDRDGLVETHPFYQELSAAVIRVLLPVLDELAKNETSGHKPGDKLARALSVAQKALLSPLRQAMQEIDEEPPVGPGVGPEVQPELMVVPPRLILRVGEERTLSVRIAGEEGLAFTAEVSAGSPQDVVEVHSISHEFKKHPRLDAVTSTFGIRAGSELGDTQITVTAGERTAFVSVSVAPEPDVPDTPITELTFERGTYRVAPEKARNLRILAPVEWAGEAVQIEVPTGPVTLPNSTCMLKASDDGRSAECTVRVVATKVLGKAHVLARGPQDSAAEAWIHIEERPVGQGLSLELQILDQESKNRRAYAQLLEGTVIVRVFGGHPTLKNVLGTYDVGAAKFSKEDDPVARAVLAEVVGLELASWLVEREANRRPELGWDPSRVISKQQERASRFVSVAQSALEERNAGE